jgi:hypothetical protein
VTRRLLPSLRALFTTPAWAVHFHADGPGDESTACFDARSERPPLATDYRLGG